MNVPKGLRRFIPDYEVRTAQQEGWGATKNGELLKLAEAAGFNVLVTADKNLTYQQNMTDRKIALVVLPSNDWSLLKPIVPRIVVLIDDATPSSYRALDLSARGPRKVRTPRLEP